MWNWSEYFFMISHDGNRKEKTKSRVEVDERKHDISVHFVFAIRKVDDWRYNYENLTKN